MGTFFRVYLTLLTWVMLALEFSCRTDPAPASLESSPQAFFHKSGLISVVASTGQVKRWDAQGSAAEEIYPGFSDVYFTQVMPDGQHVLIALANQVVVVDSTGFESSQTYARIGTDIVGAKFLTPTDVLFITRQGTIEEWRDQQKVMDLSLNWERDNPQVSQGIFSQTGNLVLTITPGDSVARVWDYNQGTLFVALTGNKAHTAPVKIGFFSSDSKQVLTSGADGQIFLWVLAGRDTFTSFPTLVGTHPGNVESLAMTLDHSMVVSGDEKGTVRLWKAQTNAQPRLGENHQNWVLWKSFYIHTGKVHSVAFSWDSQKIMSVGDDQMIRIYPNDPDFSPSWPLASIFTSFTEDGKHFLTLENPPSSNAPNEIKVWNTADLKAAQPLPSRPFAWIQGPLGNNAYYTAKFSPDGTKILADRKYAAFRGGKVDVWDIKINTTPIFMGSADDISVVYQGPVFLPGNRFLATTLLSTVNGHCDQLTLWDLKNPIPSPITGNPPTFTQWYQFPCISVITDTVIQSEPFAVFSKDGKYMFPFANTGTGTLFWDVSKIESKEFNFLGTFPNDPTQKGFFWSQFSLDDRHLYTLTKKGLFQDWDLTDPQNPAVLNQWMLFDDSNVGVFLLQQMSVSADGNLLMISMLSNHVRVFDLHHQRELFRFVPDEQESVTSADLSPDGTSVLISARINQSSRTFLWQIPTPRELFHLSL